MRSWLAVMVTVLSIGCQKPSSESPVASPRALLAAQPTPYPTRVPRTMPPRTAPPAPGPTTPPTTATPVAPQPSSAGGRTWIAVDEVGAPAWVSTPDGTTTWTDGTMALVEIRRGGRCYLYELRLRETRP